MSAEATGWVWRNSPYRGAELLVHLAIADVVNDAHENEFWMSTYTLAAKAKVSRSTVVATLGDMARRGLLEVLEPGYSARKPSRYRFSTGALAGLASANWPSPLARSPRANVMNPNERPIEASAVTGPVGKPDCVSCKGAGIRYYATAGRDAPCECTKAKVLSVVGNEQKEHNE